jgi:hypothetical protein
MSAAALALLLAAQLAAQPTPDAAAPAWPAGVAVHERAEVPWLTAALAIPLAAPPAELSVLALLLEEPDAWRGTRVQAFFDHGGRLRAAAHAGGLVLVAAGESRHGTEVVETALAVLGPIELSKDAFPAAQARALARRAFFADDAAGPAKATLWRSFFGESAAHLDEMALLRLEPADLGAAREALRKSSGHALFLEGRLEGRIEAPLDAAKLAASVAALRVREAKAGTARAPRSGERELLVSGPRRTRVLAQPVPASAVWQTPAGLGALRLLETTLAPLGEVRVEVERRGAAALLFVVVDEPHRPLEDPARGEVAAAMKRVRDPKTRLEEGPWLVMGRAELAEREAEVGARARRLAQAHLEGAPTTPDDAAQATPSLRDWLRLVLMPEALREVVVREVAAHEAPAP